MASNFGFEHQQQNINKDYERAGRDKNRDYTRAAENINKDVKKVNAQSKERQSQEPNIKEVKAKSAKIGGGWDEYFEEEDHKAALEQARGELSSILDTKAEEASHPESRTEVFHNALNAHKLESKQEEQKGIIGLLKKLFK